MRKHAESESRRDRDSKEIGSSRGFSPLRPPGSMPSVRTRSSTRVFVPKNISKVSPDGLATRVLRSGKRLASPKSFGSKGVGDGGTEDWEIVDRHEVNWWKEEEGSAEDHKEEKHASKETKREADDPGEHFSPREKSFGLYYSRKRRRSRSSAPESLSSSASTPLPDDGSIPLSTEFDDRDSSGSRYGVVFVRKHRTKRLKYPKSEFPGNASATSTACRRFARNLWISDRDPWYGSLSGMILVILRNPSVAVNSHRFTGLILSLLTGITKRSFCMFECAAFLSSGAVGRAFSSRGIDFLPVRDWNHDFSLRRAVGDAGACILFGARRLTPLLSVDFSFLPFFFASLHLSSSLSFLRRSSALHPPEAEVSVEERRLQCLKAREEENWSREEAVRSEGPAAVKPSGSVRPRKRQRRAARRSLHSYRRKSSTDLPADQKRRKLKPEQNGGVLCCSANLLVIEADRCWREEGAKVALEQSSSNSWRLTVRSGETTRHICKAEEIKPSATNRHTNAMIWAGEAGWKLEFREKKDWNLFKELQKECFERNQQDIPPKVIPIPGVREVPGYEDSAASSFARPETYIRTGDEVERAMRSESACYDMDSGDEEWLAQVNSRETGAGESGVLSEDAFEKMVSAFERAAYIRPEAPPEPEKAAELFPHFGRRDLVVSVFDYWTKRRKQRAALVRFFQGQPQKKPQASQSSLLRKKRSFKRQGSQAARGNVFFEGGVDHEDVLKARAAEVRAGKAVDSAVRLRARAQLLMANADWATFKSVMAARLAEAAEAAEPPPEVFSLMHG